MVKIQKDISVEWRTINYEWLLSEYDLWKFSQLKDRLWKFCQLGRYQKIDFPVRIKDEKKNIYFSLLHIFLKYVFLFDVITRERQLPSPR